MVRPCVVTALAASAAATCGTLLLLASSQPSPSGFGGRQSHGGPGEAPERKLLFGPLLPSTYLNYADPRGGNMKSWFSTIDASSSAQATFFAVQRTTYGYFGIQQEATLLGVIGETLGSWFYSMGAEFQGRVIFSVWDTASDSCEVLEVGDGAYHDQFTGEGTGCQIKLETRWGRVPYSFVTTSELLPDGDMKLTGYWHRNEEAMPWRLVGAIKIANEGRNLGDKGISAFIEQYRAVDYKDVRMMNYGPQFFEYDGGEWAPVTTATFSETESEHPTYETLALVTNQGSRFSMGVGGHDVVRSSTPEGTVLTLTNPGQANDSPELQLWVSLRAQGALPTGCVGQKGCNLSLSQWLHAMLPSNLLFVLSLILFLLVTIWVVSQLVQSCQKPQTNRANQRSLIRTAAVP